jgi:DNA-binding MarR family transcriptional regulator
MEARNMAGHAIRRLHQLSTHVFTKRMQEAGFDLTPVQFAAMDAIVAQPGIDQARIAAAIAYDRATIGGVIDRLEQKGFVERRVSEHDRRAREVRPTERGLEAFEKILPIVRAIQVDMLEGLDEAERATFLKLARKAIAGSPDPQSPEDGK